MGTDAVGKFLQFRPMVFPMDANGLKDFVHLFPVCPSRFFDFLEKSMYFRQLGFDVRQMECEFPCNRSVVEKR
ncbi:MAG: hypothetical protein IJS32_03555 [Kiritimatiellae bacterium]|nr:hypothetical protein [Kiritimatiellia bacterium]